jgi:hypothetical protein
MRIPALHLQIVSGGLWRAAPARREAGTPRQTDRAPAVAVRSRDVILRWLLTAGIETAGIDRRHRRLGDVLRAR